MESPPFLILRNISNDFSHDQIPSAAPAAHRSAVRKWSLSPSQRYPDAALHGKSRKTARRGANVYAAELLPQGPGILARSGGQSQTAAAGGRQLRGRLCLDHLVFQTTQ